MNRIARWLLDKRIRRLHSARHRLLDIHYEGAALKRDALKYHLICAKIDILEMHEAGFDLRRADEYDWKRN